MASSVENVKWEDFNTQCSICYEKYVCLPYSGKLTTYSTLCGHIFHKECIFNWLKNDETCPICRKTVTIKDVHQVFLDFNSPINLIEKQAEDIRQKDDQLLAELFINREYQDKIKSLEEMYSNVTDQMNQLKNELRGAELLIHELVEGQIYRLPVPNDGEHNLIPIRAPNAAINEYDPMNNEEVLTDNEDAPMDNEHAPMDNEDNAGDLYNPNIPLDLRIINISDASDDNN